MLQDSLLVPSDDLNDHVYDQAEYECIAKCCDEAKSARNREDQAYHSNHDNCSQQDNKCNHLSHSLHNRSCEFRELNFPF